MASLDINIKQRPNEIEIAPAQPIWPWLLRPADPVPLNNIEQIAERANAYFTLCFEQNEKPKLSGLALAMGVSGPISLQRLAQRRPELRWMISRCLTAVAHTYESMIAEGSSPTGPIFMLKHLPEFDVDEPEGSKPIQYWNEKRELVIDARVVGVKRPEDAGADLSPREVYMRIIHGDSIEENVYEDVVDGELNSKAVKVSSLEQLLESGPKYETFDEDNRS